jgi:hypothetical protein
MFYASQEGTYYRFTRKRLPSSERLEETRGGSMSIQPRFKKPVVATVIPFSGSRMMSPEKAAEYTNECIDTI